MTKQVCSSQSKIEWGLRRLVRRSQRQQMGEVFGEDKAWHCIFQQTEKHYTYILAVDLRISTWKAISNLYLAAALADLSQKCTRYLAWEPTIWKNRPKRKRRSLKCTFQEKPVIKGWLPSSKSSSKYKLAFLSLWVPRVDYNTNILLIQGRV